MHVTMVHVVVKPERVGDFIEVTKQNHLESVKEPGNLRFDVLQSTENPCRFVLYEAYEDAEDSSAHKATAHYLRWREQVANWMAEPRVGVTYRGICPPDRKDW